MKTPKTKSELMRVIEEASLNYQTEHLKSEPDEYGKPNRKVLDSYAQAHEKGSQFAIPLIANMILEKLRQPRHPDIDQSGLFWGDFTTRNVLASNLEFELKREGIL